MTDRDIYASANLVIRRFGEDAKIEAPSAPTSCLMPRPGWSGGVDADHQSDRGVAEHQQARG
jgi:hypothetical protein